MILTLKVLVALTFVFTASGKLPCVSNSEFARSKQIHERVGRKSIVPHRNDALITTGRRDAAFLSAENAAESLPDDMSIKNAVRNTIITMTAAALFGVGTWIVKGEKSGIEYFTGFIIEKSLSVDNLFVFLMLFDYFKVPFKYQSRVLTWGLLGAVVMRGIMIAVGISIVEKFKWVTLFFAGILLLSSYKLLTEKESGDHGPQEENAIMKLASKMFKSTDKYDGEKFFTKISTKDAKSNKVIVEKIATPLLMCLVCIELSDFAFAVDSIPAVLAVSRDPFIVYSSNIFAILGLRSLYILISRAVADLKYIRPSVALVLAFVGGKMIAEYFHYEVTSAVSLLVISVLLGGGIALSLLARDKLPPSRSG